MRAQFTRWTERDITVLVSLWPDPKQTPRKIGEVVARGPEAVEAKARALKLPSRMGMVINAWTPAEEAMLAELQPIKTNAEIGAILGRTENAVFDKLRRLKMRRNKVVRRPTNQMRWSKDDEIKLQRMVHDGATTQSMVAAFPGRSINSVSNKLSSMGLKEAVRKSLAGTAPPAEIAGVVSVSPPPPLPIGEFHWTPPAQIIPPPTVISDAKTCQYISGGMKDRVPNPVKFCGSPTFKRSLCEEHFRLCWQVREPVA